MTSSNGNIFALLAFYAGNPPVTGEIPAQRPVTQSFDVFCDLRLNKRLSKQSRGWWFETPFTVMLKIGIYITYWRTGMIPNNRVPWCISLYDALCITDAGAKMRSIQWYDIWKWTEIEYGQRICRRIMMGFLPSCLKSILKLLMKYDPLPKTPSHLRPISALMEFRSHH